MAVTAWPCPLTPMTLNIIFSAISTYLMIICSKFNWRPFAEISRQAKNCLDLTMTLTFDLWPLTLEAVSAMASLGSPGIICVWSICPAAACRGGVFRLRKSLRKHLEIWHYERCLQRGRLPCFIEEFLKNRKFHVRIGSCYSDVFDQEMGVP